MSNHLATEDHLPGCPTALSIPGAHEECRCSELAALFRVPTREECFADEDPARRHERWRTARAEAARRYAELMQDLLADEKQAFARFRETAASSAELERQIRTARQLLERQRRSTPRL